MDARTFVLLALTAGTFLITYPTGILLARSLGIDHYDEYAIAVAAVTMLSTFSELGAGKLAMRILPAYAETGEWGSARGYRRFAGRAILLASVLVAGIVKNIKYVDFGQLVRLRSDREKILIDLAGQEHRRNQSSFDDKSAFDGQRAIQLAQ